MTYLAHGLRINSEIPLHAIESDVHSPDADVDLTISLTSRIADITDAAELILSYDFDNGQSVRAAERADGSTVITVSDVARYRISAHHDRIEVDPRSADSQGLAAILVEGWIMSTVLMLRGSGVFHATALEYDSRCVALLGDSGQGKSTTAAMLIRDGAQLVSDDVLRVEPNDDGFDAFPGIVALRLRNAAKKLLGPLSEQGANLSPTSDDRTSVAFDRKDAAPVPLAAVLIPIVERESDDVSVQWLDPMVATVELNLYPRVFDWHIDGPVRRHFSLSAAIASQTPVGLLQVPWGAPWSARLLETAFDI